MFVLLLIIVVGGAAGFLAKKDTVVVKMDQDSFKISDEVSFGVRNFSLRKIEFPPCMQGVDFEREVEGEWVDFAVFVQECNPDAANETMFPLTGRNYAIKLDTGDSESGSVLKQRLENAAKVVITGKYRAYFEYYATDGSKVKAVSEPFEVTQ